MKVSSKVSIFVTLGWLVGAGLSDAYAACNTPGSTFFSGYFDAPIGQTTLATDGAFWGLGHFNPSHPGGTDNGTWPTSAWLVYGPGVGFYLAGDWSLDAGIDGCIQDPPNLQPAKMAAAWTTSDGTDAYFVALCAGEDGNGAFSNFVNIAGRPMTRVPMAVVSASSHTSNSMVLTVGHESIAGGVYNTGGCALGITGFKIYRQVVPDNAPAPGGPNSRHPSLGWTLLGQSFGSGTTFGTVPCAANSDIYLMTTLVLDGNVELQQGSRNSTKVECTPAACSPSCDDGNLCTTDSCSGPTASDCVHTMLACDDGNPCTADSCVPGTGQCVHDTNLCDDGNPCTSDSCDPGTGLCVHDTNRCNDGDPCTTDSCLLPAGICQHTNPCDDGSPCTADSCVLPGGGCQHLNLCDDGNVCTTDSCDLSSGCQHSAVTNGTVCGDSTQHPCGTTCQNGTCQAIFVADGTPCDDGHGCTLGETCQSGSCVARLSFANASGSPYAAGTSPWSVAAGYLNADGNLDLAVANRDSFDVTVLMGDGSGGFNPGAGSPFSALGGNPRSLAIADLNGDGSHDLAVAIESGAHVQVDLLLGDGQGGFTPGLGSPLQPAGPATHAYFIAVGDLNGDGRPDLAVADHPTDGSAGYVTILLRNGGSFTQAAGSPLAAGMLPAFIAVGELNGDGRPDLAVANEGGGLTILLGDGSGRFNPAPGSPVAVGANPVSVAIGDWNGDGTLDLAVVNQGSGSVTSLLGNGNGAFTPGLPVSVGSNPVFVTAGDMNGDGTLDLAVANYASAGVRASILVGNGEGGFNPSSAFGELMDPRSIALGDFNWDGKLDFATANSGSNNASIYLNDTVRASSRAAEVDSYVRLAKSGAGAVIHWNFPACAGYSDILRGLVSALPVGPSGGDETCLAYGLSPATTTWTDPENPPAPRAAYWYLVRGDNPPSAGSPGPWGYRNHPATEEVSTTCP